MNSLLETLRDRLVENGWTVSTAESCTGGRIGALMTEVSGSSRFYQGGIIAYQNEVKTRELGVPAEMIEQYDVVSEPVVRAMVQGACRKFGTTFALASTGYAEAWEGHDVEIWIGWGTVDSIHTLHLTTDLGRLANVESAAKRVVEEFANNMAWTLKRMHGIETSDAPEREPWTPMHFIK